MMAKTADPVIQEPVVRRLVYGKLLLGRAVETARAGGLLAPALACLPLQDGVELILRAIAAHVRAEAGPQERFHKLIENISNVAPPVPLRQHLLDLNQARVNFKHAGNLPTEPDIKGYIQAAESFAREAVPLYLDGFSWDSVSLAGLVEHRRCRNHLILAEGHLSEGSFREALKACGTAFSALFRSSLPIRGVRHGLFRLSLDYRDMGLQNQQALTSYLRELDQEVEGQGQLLDMLLAGVDIPRFKRFYAYVGVGLAGSLPFNLPSETLGLLQPMEPSKEGVESCIAFVIDTALKMQQERPAGESVWRLVREESSSSNKRTFCLRQGKMRKRSARPDEERFSAVNHRTLVVTASPPLNRFEQLPMSSRLRSSVSIARRMRRTTNQAR